MAAQQSEAQGPTSQQHIAISKPYPVSVVPVHGITIHLHRATRRAAGGAGAHQIAGSGARRLAAGAGKAGGRRARRTRTAHAAKQKQAQGPGQGRGRIGRRGGLRGKWQAACAANGRRPARSATERLGRRSPA